MFEAEVWDRANQGWQNKNADESRPPHPSHSASLANLVLVELRLNAPAFNNRPCVSVVAGAPAAQTIAIFRKTAVLVTHGLCQPIFGNRLEQPSSLAAIISTGLQPLALHRRNESRTRRGSDRRSQSAFTDAIIWCAQMLPFS